MLAFSLDDKRLFNVDTSYTATAIISKKLVHPINLSFRYHFSYIFIMLMSGSSRCQEKYLLIVHLTRWKLHGRIEIPCVYGLSPVRVSIIVNFCMSLALLIIVCIFISYKRDAACAYA